MLGVEKLGIAFVILTVLIGVEHIGIMLVEMWASPKKQAEMFDLNESYTKQKEARVSFANQGIYNGMLGLSLIASQWLFTGMNAIMVSRLLLVFVAVVGLYGGLTASKKIWFVQFLPAVIALILSI